ncbi:MAG: phosphotransferase [Massiliimalia sp.]|jgi:Ser/Thr protein kinase RdoA (MazF antagonist)
MNSQLIESNYDINVSNITLLDEHFGTKIYLINADNQKYIVKTVPLFFENIENEGLITEFLYGCGYKVARLLKSKDGKYVIKTSEFQFTVQEYIEGQILPINSAPEWYLEKSVEFLGKTTLTLKDYDPLPLRFGKDFFTADTAIVKKQQYIDELEKAKKSDNQKTIPIWEEQIRHLERISKFQIDAGKLTYANSHGDFHIGQVIVKDYDFTVIDWSSACRLPVCLEVITSYVFASPSCSTGAVDAEGLNRYIQAYTKHFPLTEYDIKTMPYVLYFWHCICNYHPDELVCIAKTYQPIATLIQKMLNWLYVHVEELSEALKL